jgi:hypothetical protein
MLQIDFGTSRKDGKTSSDILTALAPLFGPLFVIAATASGRQLSRKDRYDPDTFLNNMQSLPTEFWSASSTRHFGHIYVVTIDKTSTKETDAMQPPIFMKGEASHSIFVSFVRQVFNGAFAAQRKFNLAAVFVHWGILHENVMNRVYLREFVLGPFIDIWAKKNQPFGRWTNGANELVVIAWKTVNLLTIFVSRWFAA